MSTNAEQHKLTGALQLLNELKYSDQTTPYLTTQHRRHYMVRSPIRDEIRILDTIAVLLTSRRPGDVTAAALDRYEGLVLVLAKNGLPNDEDIETTRALISILTNPSTQKAADLTDFLFVHCRENMQKRIYELNQSLSDFYTRPPGNSQPTDFQCRVSTHEPKPSMKQEFPKSANYDFGTPEASFKDTISHLFERCIKESSLDLDPDDPQNSMCKFRQLCRTAGVLLHSGFLERSCWTLSGLQICRAKRLKRRLAKVCLYHDGVYKLIKAAKRTFCNGISFQWVEDALPQTGEAEIHLDEDHFHTFELIFKSPLSSVKRTQLGGRISALASDWENRRHIRTRIHAEIRIILYFFLHQRPRAPEFLPIGCSKRSCLCCTFWIEGYNSKFGTHWMTSGSDGKPRVDWALPGDVGDGYLLEGKGWIDCQVVIGITSRLVQSAFGPDGCDYDSD